MCLILNDAYMNQDRHIEMIFLSCSTASYIRCAALVDDNNDADHDDAESDIGFMLRLNKKSYSFKRRCDDVIDCCS